MARLAKGGDRTHTDADQAVKELQRGGVDLHKLSIIKGYPTDEHAVGTTMLATT